MTIVISEHITLLGHAVGR